MPTYQYECESCGHVFDIMQSITEKKLQKCPKCNKNSLQRLIGTGSGIVFKGNGFYETDYKKKKATPETCPANKSKECSNACPMKETGKSA